MSRVAKRLSQATSSGGTVGNGCRFEEMRFLKSGDVVELEVEGIGVLRNRVLQD